MRLLKVILFVSVLMLTCVRCEKNGSNWRQSLGLCIETKNTSCIAEICEYKCRNGSLTVNDGIQKARENLVPPEVHCQDAGLLVLVWKAAKGESYFLEYSSNEERNYTDLTNNGYEFIRGLNTNTNYTIRLTSLRVSNNYDIHLQRSPEISIRTLPRRRTPLPVTDVFVDSFNLVNRSYDAIIKWEQAEDQSCYYDIVWFGGPEIGDIKTMEINKTLSSNTANISALQFGQHYSLSIRAVSDSKFRTESPPRWLTFTVPTCLDTFQSLTYCAPEAPEDLEVEETIRNINQAGLSFYDIRISWSQPNFTPNFYTASVFNQLNNAGIQMNITGNQTSAEYINIELGSYYQVSLVAHSVKGPSPPTITDRFVNSTAPLLTREQLMSTEVVLLIVSPFVVICLVLMLMFNHFFVKKVRNNYFKKLEEKALPRVSYITTLTNISEQPDEWELLPEKLLTKDVLGEGAFGVVRKGYYFVENESIDVAIKMLKDNPTQEELKQFYQEIDIMKSVPTHPHLVSLIGCITQGTNQRPLLVVEYCSKGDLQTYLRNAWNQLTNTFRNEKPYFSTSLESIKYATNKLYDFNIGQDNDIPQPRDLISFARQITMGMEYLSSLKLIHRDLAARNVLICEDNIVKISDFGLSRDVYHDKVYCKTTGGKLPLRWMALESMTHQVYTTHSDVWSFGILLWEIVTLGSTPYPGVSTADLLALLKSGYRMEKPSNCNSELYTIMCKCWKAAPRERPTFSELRKTLDDILESVSNYLHLTVIESTDIYICSKNSISDYNNVNYSDGYIKG